MPEEFDRLWTINDAARYLHIHPMTVRNLISRGELPCVRVGYSIRFRKEDIMAYLGDNNRPASTCRRNVK